MVLREERRPQAHIPELDGIRGLAIALVLAYHFFYVPVVMVPGGLTWHLLAPLRLDWTGVDLFFVLSGFLIGGILLDARGASNFFKTFYTRRFYRIVPLYAAVLAASFVHMTILAHGLFPRYGWMLDARLPWFSYLFFVQNFWMAAGNTFGTWGLGGTWSLAVEEQFYLTLPSLIWLFEPKRLRHILIAAIVAAPILRTILSIRWPNNWMITHVMMPCRVDALLLGVLAAMALRSPTQRAFLERHHRVILCSIFALLLGCAVLVHVAASPDSRIMRSFGLTGIAILYTLILLYALTRKSSILSSFFRLPPLRSLGTIAYGVYLLHAQVLTLLTVLISPGHPFRSDWPPLDSWRQLAITVAALLVTFALCEFSWQYFEKPLVKLGHRSSYDLSALTVPPSQRQPDKQRERAEESV